MATKKSPKSIQAIQGETGIQEPQIPYYKYSDQVNPTYKMYTLLRSPRGWHCAIYTVDQNDQIVSKSLTEAMTRGGATEELKITLYKNLLHNIDSVEGYDLMEVK